MGQKAYDILIVGGGVIGSSIAYHLLNDGLDGTVAVLEKDPSYEFASTPRSMGGIRQQFTTEINIRICQYSIEAIERFDEEMAVDGLYVAGGFSGHGLMQSPAAGKGMSELIRTGRYETLDLSPLGLDRIFTERRVLEEAVF